MMPDNRELKPLGRGEDEAFEVRTCDKKESVKSKSQMRLKMAKGGV